MSYQPKSGGQPPSFKTNVNRAKTKRWVEAKSYTYDGDDWGDADEYDEYGGYEEPPLPQKPTGLRQQGQSAHAVSQSPYAGPTDPYQRPGGNVMPGYTNMGGPQKAGLRSATNPQPHISMNLARSNSFDRGDEKRAFSAGGLPPAQQQFNTQGQTHDGPNIQSPTQFDPNTMRSAQSDPRRTNPEQQNQFYPDQAARGTDARYDGQAHSQESMYPQEPRYPNTDSRTQSMTSNNSATDIHNRRDFTPSALPQPLHTRSSPSPDSRLASHHPPRKSSLSQTSQPQLPPSNQTVTFPDPQVVQRGRTGSNADKPLPFVRPSDIYKRMQEEKERERQSQESSRPSMDAIVGVSRQADTDTHLPPQEEEQHFLDSASDHASVKRMTASRPRIQVDQGSLHWTLSRNTKASPGFKEAL